MVPNPPSDDQEIKYELEYVMVLFIVFTIYQLYKLKLESSTFGNIYDSLK